MSPTPPKAHYCPDCGHALFERCFYLGHQKVFVCLQCHETWPEWKIRRRMMRVVKDDD